MIAKQVWLQARNYLRKFNIRLVALKGRRVKKSLAKFLPIILAICLLFVSTGALFFNTREWEKQGFLFDFEEKSDSLCSNLQVELSEDIEILNSIRSFYDSSPDVTRQEFHTFVEHSLSSRQSIQALEWIPRVPDKERAAFELAARQDGYSQFQFTERQTQGQMIPAAQRAEYFPVYYVEPYKGNEIASGFDLASDPTRLEALNQARDTGKPTATARITLVQETAQQSGFLVFVPVYYNGSTPSTVEERRQNLRGYALGVFRVVDVINASVKTEQRGELNIELYDESAPTGERLLYSSQPNLQQGVDNLSDYQAVNDSSNELQQLINVNLDGREWSLRITPTPNYLATSHSWVSWTVLLSGLILSSLLGYSMLQGVTRALNIEKLANELSINNAALNEEIIIRKKTEQALKASESKYEELVERGNDGIVIIQDGQLIFANSKMREMTHLSEEEYIGKPFVDFVTPEYRELVIERYKKRLYGEKVPDQYEIEVVAKDGTKIPVEVNASIIGNQGKSAEMAIIRDVAERKLMEKALKASEEKFRNLVENLPVGVVVNTLDGHPVERNLASQQMHGYSSKEEFNQVNVADLYVDPGDRERFLKNLTGGMVRDFETKHKRKDGSTFWISLTALPYIGENGEKQALIISQDIDERKKAEEALKASEKRFRNLVETAPVGIGITTLSGLPVMRNRALQEIYGYDSEEEFMKSSGIERFFSPEDRKTFVELTLKDKVKNLEMRMRRKDGSPFWALLTTTLITGESGEQQILTITQDINAIKQAEENLKASEEKFRNLIENAPVGIAITLLDGTPIVRNAFNQKIHGYDSKEEFMKTNSKDLYYDISDRKRWLELLEQGHVKDFEVLHKRKDKSTFWVSLTAIKYTLGFGEQQLILITQDITERKKMDEQLMVTNRLASIGELASGVAHEVNNPLTSVIGFSELLLERPLPQEVKEDIGVIRDEAQRAAHVVRNLLTFARKHASTRQSVNVNGIIEKVLELRAYEQTVNNINVVKQLSPDVPEITADFFQLQQVFFNLIINAEYFMGEAHKRGTLTITTERVDSIVRIKIADDGPGISEESLGHLFNPFFTTKPVGRGTGLGLSICHGIVTDHNGKMYVESVPGKGATFIVELPVGGK